MPATMRTVLGDAITVPSRWLALNETPASPAIQVLTPFTRAWLPQRLAADEELAKPLTDRVCPGIHQGPTGGER